MPQRSANGRRLGRVSRFRRRVPLCGATVWRLYRAENFRDFFVVADLESDGVFRTRSGTSIDLQKSDRDWRSKKYFVLLRKIAISEGPLLMTSRRLKCISPRGGGHRGLPRTS